jgi:5,5'-dehydrodivanillate O-demethylase oxygenase subunit
MLSEADNRKLTEIEPGTPMGDLLRCYWHPVAGIAEFKDKSVKAIRLFGEDLVLYKDLSGTYGLIDRQCPHRRADLSYGFVEQCGLRCNYHGWKYDERGACVEQPFDDLANPKGKFKEKIKIRSYPVRAHAGMIWAYMGKAPAPQLPNWEPFTWQHCFTQIVSTVVPCNWLQCQENSIDPVHFEWMHHNWSANMRGEGPQGYGPKHVKVAFDENDFGYIYRRVREDTDEEHEMWAVGRMFLWPNCFFLGDHFEWRVPIDNENTLSITWATIRVPPNMEPFVQDDIPFWEGPLADETSGRWIATHVMNQDFIAWIGQGTVADRTKENLGPSDKGIAMIRRRLMQDMDRVAKGEDPKGLIRDPAQNVCVTLPVAERDMLVNGWPLEKLQKHALMGRHMKGYVFQAGQPADVRAAFVKAMGLPEDRPGTTGAMVA